MPQPAKESKQTVRLEQDESLQYFHRIGNKKGTCGYGNAFPALIAVKETHRQSESFGSPFPFARIGVGGRMTTQDYQAKCNSIEKARSRRGWQGVEDNGHDVQVSPELSAQLSFVLGTVLRPNFMLTALIRQIAPFASSECSSLTTLAAFPPLYSRSLAFGIGLKRTHADLYITATHQDGHCICQSGGTTRLV